MEWNIEIGDIPANEYTRFTCDRDSVSIGRGEDNDISIDNRYISARHAVISDRDGHVWVFDNGSANGTLLLQDNEWVPVEGEVRTGLPFKLKLAKTVVLTVHAPQDESMISSISMFERVESIMVLDLCDSMKTAYHNDEMSFHLIKRLNDLAKPIIYDHDVLFFKSTGDGFLATFAHSAEAFSASGAIMETLSQRNDRTDNPKIHVRIALNRGKIYTIDPVTGDIHGNDTNITFRLEGVQHEAFADLKHRFPSQDRILCTQPFYQDLVGEGGGPTDAIYCGLARLKGVEGLTDVYWLR